MNFGQAELKAVANMFPRSLSDESQYSPPVDFSDTSVEPRSSIPVVLLMWRVDLALDTTKNTHVRLRAIIYDCTSSLVDKDSEVSPNSVASMPGTSGYVQEDG